MRRSSGGWGGGDEGKMRAAKQTRDAQQRSLPHRKNGDISTRFD
jgi:hypothetical protein